MLKTSVIILSAMVLVSARSIIQEDVCKCDGSNLDCSNRYLESLTSAIPPALPCSEMKYIQVDRNQLHALDFPKSMSGLQSVVYINASYNRLKSLDGIFGWSGGQLDVQNNQLKTIDLSRATKMEELHAHDNVLQEIVLPTEKCSLLIMTLQNNLLRSLPDGLDRCKTLFYIDASYNSLTNLDVSFAHRLENIKISNNALRTIKLPTEGGCKLIHLNASSNYLSFISDSILKCTKLETIDLSNNLLPAIPQAIMQLLKLRKFELKDGDPNFPEVLVDLRKNSRLTFTAVSKAFRELRKSEGQIRIFYNKYESECECAVLKLHDLDYAAVQFCISAMCSHGGLDLWYYV